MVGLDVSDAAITERGRVSHPTGDGACPGPIPVDRGPASMAADGTSTSTTDGGGASSSSGSGSGTSAGASRSSGGAAAEATGKPVPIDPVTTTVVATERQNANDTPAAAPAIAPSSPATIVPTAPDAPTSSTIAPDCYQPITPVNRAVIVGDTAYTVSEAGVLASNLSDLGERGWLPFS
jgi:hypothetical protein